jgi:2'-5' RNA ligase
MADIRAFIAVDIPQETKMDIDRLISGFRADGSGIRWVKAANLHLTLRFLGDIPQESMPQLAESLKANVDGFGTFDLMLKGIGAFPNLRRPRVIWIGTDKGTDRLSELAGRVEKSCVDSGFGRADKKFSSHLTIGRVKFPKGLDRLLGKIGKTEFESPEFDVGEISVVKSDLSPAGPKYTKLENISL